MDRQYERRVGAWSEGDLIGGRLTPAEITTLTQHLEDTEPEDGPPGVTREELTALREKAEVFGALLGAAQESAAGCCAYEKCNGKIPQDHIAGCWMNDHRLLAAEEASYL